MWFVLLILAQFISRQQCQQQQSYNGGQFDSFFPEKLYTHKSLEPSELSEALRVLEGKCIDNLESPDWWAYVWCFEKQIKQVHYDFKVKQLKAAHLIGTWSEEESGADHHIYRGHEADCRGDDGSFMVRYAEVQLLCCDESVHITSRGLRLPQDEGEDGVASGAESFTFLESVVEPVPCNYYFRVCSTLVCDPTGRHHPPNGNQASRNDINAQQKQQMQQQQQQQPKQQQQQRQQQRRSDNLMHKHQPYEAKKTPTNTNQPNRTPFKHKRLQEKRVKHSSVAPPRKVAATEPSRPHRNVKIPDIAAQKDMLSRVEKMFYHAYDAYMHKAAPEVRMLMKACIILKLAE